MTAHVLEDEACWLVGKGSSEGRSVFQAHLSFGQRHA